MDSRNRAAGAPGPTEWLLAFLGARERARRTRTGVASGPAEWLLVFLEAGRAEPAPRRGPAPMPSRRGGTEESPFGRSSARSA
ncbi:hypothetical protein [Actinomadura sp. WMMA1423]|uniref:hypothetical protein n=1 Tax=Actinomadura sp. WMMA1423 TaxID=2591108 RepID=UPI00114651CF|nr:hypothetical protein [Actinomadura sp. WMMA1423]